MHKPFQRLLKLVGFAVVHDPHLHELPLLVRRAAVCQVHQRQFVSLQGARIVPPLPKGRLQIEVQDDLENFVEPAWAANN